MQTFHEVYEKHEKNLALYVPVVARVHGGHRPEFHEVMAVYNRIVEKIEAHRTETKTELKADAIHLFDEFNMLQNITSNYLIPDDVCETYEAVYQMLEELALAYLA